MASFVQQPNIKGKGVSSHCEKQPRILLAATGCVSAVKFGTLCRSFQGWAEVKGVVSKAALNFIDVRSIPEDVAIFTDIADISFWKKIGDPVLHIELGQWADILVIAPLSANTLAKIATGLCDDLLSCLVRAWDYSKPFFIAPSMHPSMWESTLTENHFMSLDELGVKWIPPISVRLPGGGYGTGPMADVSQIYDTVRFYWEKHH